MQVGQQIDDVDIRYKGNENETIDDDNDGERVDWINMNEKRCGNSNR
jgi:hypothetical protein